MAKSNPLFVDSTKLRGDRIDTNIELNNVLVYDGETVVVVIKNVRGETERFIMKVVDDTSFKARVWLGHQETINYRFEIEKDSAVVLQSSTKQARAQYAIVEKWEAVFDEPEMASPILKDESRFFSQPSPAKAAASYTNSLGSIIEKWGL
jgi:hypothetical protein